MNPTFAALPLVLMMSSVSWSALRCADSVATSSTKVQDVVDHLNNVNGYSVTLTSSGLVITHPKQGTKLVALNETDHRLHSLDRLSDDQFVVTYFEPAIYGQVGRENHVYSVQVLSVDKNGDLQPVQKISTAVGVRIQQVEVLNKNSFIMTTNEGMNNLGQAQVYSREGSGSFKVVDRLKGLDYLASLTMKDAESGIYIQRADHVTNYDRLMTIEKGQLNKNSVLNGTQGQRMEILNADSGLITINQPNKFTSTRYFQDMVVHQVKGRQVKKLGTVVAEKKNGMFEPHRSAEKYGEGFVVLDSWSGAYGINQNWMLDRKLQIVTIDAGKMKTKTLVINDGETVSRNDAQATPLKIDVLSNKEILLVGNSYIQVVRNNKLAEVVKFESNLPMDRAEVKQISSTRFIIVDLYVLDRMIDNSTYKSQLHVFDLVGGKYVRTGTKTFDGRRFNSPTVLDANTIRVDIRSGDGKTPNLMDVQLDNL